MRERGMGYELAFYLTAGLLLAGAFFVVISKNAIHSVLSLLVVVGCLSILFVLLGFQLLAFLQLYIYAGAIVALFLMVTMLLSLRAESVIQIRQKLLWGFGVLLAVSVTALLLGAVLTVPAGPSGVGRPVEPMSALTVKELARQLFTIYFLPFEMTTLLMLIAVIGVVALVRKRPSPQSGQGASPEVMPSPQRSRGPLPPGGPQGVTK